RGREVRLEIRDWGIGFDPDSVADGHFGLDGIRQRVKLLDGKLAISSRPGEGTTIQVTVPILQESSGAQTN
ncbi:MAG: hypothetical protein U1E05_16090, partial [Patescibacteria group bacterium]|nr:hypothetical protein [Patescibacteria group bacterium]